MNKLLLAVLFLAITGKCVAERPENEIVPGINAARKQLADDYNISNMKAMKWSTDLAGRLPSSSGSCKTSTTKYNDSIIIEFSKSDLGLVGLPSEPEAFYAVAKHFVNDPDQTEIAWKRLGNCTGDFFAVAIGPHARAPNKLPATPPSKTVTIAPTPEAPEAPKIDPSPLGTNAPGSSPSATTSSAMSSPVVFLAIALVFFGF